MPDRTIIRIKNASLYAYHGVASDEQNLGGKFEIDVELQADLLAAMQNDDLKRTVDYEAVYALVKSIATSKKYYLIEALAKAIIDGIIRSFPIVETVSVKVRKPHPPVKGVIDFVEVEVIGHR